MNQGKLLLVALWKCWLFDGLSLSSVQFCSFELWNLKHSVFAYYFPVFKLIKNWVSWICKLVHVNTNASKIIWNKFTWKRIYFTTSEVKVSTGCQPPRICSRLSKPAVILHKVTLSCHQAAIFEEISSASSSYLLRGTSGCKTCDCTATSSSGVCASTSTSKTRSLQTTSLPCSVPAISKSSRAQRSSERWHR